MTLLDSVYSNVFQNGVSRNKTQKVLQLKNKHYELAFFGSSRTENHIDCTLITELTGKSCVNLGLSGATLGDILVLLTLAESNQVTFEEVFIQLDYSYNNAKLSNNFRASLAPYLNNTKVKAYLREEGEDFFYFNMPFYRYMKYDGVVGFREFFSVLNHKSPKRNIDEGFLPKTGIGLDIKDDLPATYEDNNLALDKIKELKKHNDYNLHYFIAPYCKYAKNRDKMSILKSRENPLENYVSVFDDYDDYFFNCGHLNIEGAKAFTQIIIADLILPLSNNKGLEN
jgi:hypothetical protein